MQAPLELDPLTGGHGVEHGGRDGQVGHQLLVHHNDALFGDGPQAELGLRRVTQLAHHHHVERRAEGVGHLEGHRHAAAGHAHHHGAPRRAVLAGRFAGGAVECVAHRTTQLPARVTTVDEWHR